MCGDPESRFYPQRSVCYATVERFLTEKRYAELHAEGSGARFHDGSEMSWSEHEDEDHRVPAGTGHTIWVADADLEPDATWLSARGAVSLTKESDED